MDQQWVAYGLTGSTIAIPAFSGIFFGLSKKARDGDLWDIHFLTNGLWFGLLGIGVLTPALIDHPDYYAFLPLPFLCMLVVILFLMAMIVAVPVSVLISALTKKLANLLRS